MEITFSLKELLLYLVALFSIFSPFAVIGPYTDLTKDFSFGVRNKIAFRVGIFTILNLILIAWLGDLFLQILGISLGALRCAGGMVLILASLPMIRKGGSPRRKVDMDLRSCFRVLGRMPPDCSYKKIFLDRKPYLL